MKELSAKARALIETVGDADGPALGTRERVRAALGASIGAGAALGGSTALGAPSSAGASAQLAASAWTLGGKGSAAIALWFVAGGAAGMAVATPLALVADPASPAAVTQPAAPTSHRSVEPSPAVAGARAAPVESAATPLGVNGTAKLSSHSANKAVGARGLAVPVPGVASPAASLVPAADMGAELALLKAAQRELNSSNAAASLGLLDDHAQRYPDGALKAERLGARVFALCKLGRVEEARAAAREFMSAAADSPLVPRVLASCAGRGTETPP